MKRIILLFLFFILIGLRVFSQSCPNSVIYDSTNHIVCSKDTIQLNCEMEYVVLSPKVFAPGASNNYTVESIPYSPPCPYNISSSATEYFLPSDDIWGPIMDLNFGQPVNVPQFKFSFYGQNNLTQCVVGSNGLLSWNLSVASLSCAWNFENESPIPNSGFVYKNCIYGPYQDMDFAAAGGIGNMYFEIFGTYPCRKIVLSFDNVPMFHCNSMRAYNMIVLYETTNTIEFYMQNKPICSTWNNGEAILGIQNSSGTQATVVSNYNLPNQWSATNQAWRIRPQGNLRSYTNWYKRPVNGGSRISIPTDSTYLITANPTSQEGAQWYIMETKIIRLDSVELTFLDSCLVKPYDFRDFVITHNGNTSHYDTICRGGNISIQFRGGNSYKMISPFIQEIIDTNSTIISPLVDTTYIFESRTYYGNNLQSCILIDSFHVHLNSPNLELGENKIICRQDELKLWNIYESSSNNYTWYYNINNPISNEDTLVLSPQSTSYMYLKLTDSINCFTIDSVLISVNERPEFNIMGETSICRGIYTNLRIEPSSLSYSYLWNTGQTTDSINVNPQANTWYKVIVSNNNNCTRVDSLEVIVSNPISNTIQAEICNGQVYNLYGFNDSIGGFYTKELQTLNGCDSIVNLDLHVNPIYNNTIQAEICKGNIYNLYGFNDSIEGLYTHLLQTQKGCDSIINLNLHINPIYNDTIYAEICNGQTYNQFGFNINNEGICTHSFQTFKGCDSIVNINLHINQKYNDTIQAEICQGEIYNLFGFNENNEGLYTHTLQTIKGCDSIVNLRLGVNPIYIDTIRAEICNGQTYNQYDFNLSQGGFYTHSFQTLKGCDSIVNLSLILNPVYNNTIQAEICNGQTYTQNGFNENNEGFYTHALQTFKGCDSIVNLSLSVNPVYNNTIESEICKGETYSLFGFNENNEGFYTHTLQTIKGCDSIVNLYLRVNPTYFDTLNVKKCHGEIYTQNGFNESLEGFYTHSFQTIKGCDSIVNLKLVNSDYFDTIITEICNGETYTQNGFNESLDGFYTHSFQTINGCDSILNLELKVNPIFNDTIEAEICKGEIYSQFGFNEYLEGFYIHSYQTIKGCDSIVNLYLKLNPTYHDTLYVEICQGETYNQNGFNESVEGFYTHALQTIKGCDSIVNLNLVNPDYVDTIHAEICNGEIYTQNGFNENIEGFYTKNLKSQKGCDSIINLSLRVNPKYNISFDSVICEGTSYTLNGFNESNQGTYSKVLSSSKGCDSIVNLNLSVIETPQNYSLIDNKYVIAEELPITIDVSCENCISYFWNTGSRDSVYEINHIGNYYVSIEHVCGMIFDSLIVVYPDVYIYIPNAFTPNENKNNTFFPVFETKEKVFIESFEIYNRWGSIIYFSRNKGWDGKYNGKLCDNGVYVWRLLYKTKYTGNNIFEKTGDVNLIR